MYIVDIELNCIKRHVIKGGLAIVVGVPGSVENFSGLTKFGPNKYFIISPKLCFPGANFYSQSDPSCS